jgi:hypothetical protein
MFVKYLYWIGIAACITLIVSCFLPWVYFPVINETFTGFHVTKFPNGNYYGRAGYPITIMTSVIMIFMVVQKVWAKRTNLFLCALLFAYIFRTYNLFTGSLIKGEVINKIGIYLILISSVIMLIAALFPDMKIIQPKKN